MAINPKLLKKYQTGGYVNPYDIPGTGTGEGQLFGGQGGGGIEGSEFDQGGGGGAAGPGTGFYTPGYGGTPGTGIGDDDTMSDEQIPPSEQYDLWFNWFEDLGAGNSSTDWGELQDLINSGATDEQIYEWGFQNFPQEMSGLPGSDYDPWQGMSGTDEMVELNELMDDFGGFTNFYEQAESLGFTSMEMAEIMGDMLSSGTEPSDIVDMLEGEFGFDEDWGEELGTTIGNQYLQVQEEPPLPEGVHGQQYDESTGQYYDPSTGQSWTFDEAGNAVFGEGAPIETIMQDDFVGMTELNPEMQNYLESFLGEDWAVLTTSGESQVSNPLYTQIQNDFAAQGGDISDIAAMTEWAQSPASGYGSSPDNGLTWVSYYADGLPGQTVSQSWTESEPMDWSDEDMILQKFKEAKDNEDLDLGGIRGLDPETLEKMKDGTYDGAREVAREGIISEVSNKLNPKALGSALNPELLVGQFKTEYQKKASEVEGAVEKKKGAAEKDVMEIMGEWNDIFQAGG
tara:strand:+ start:5430 stop:6965 length:1536 start_codon:yes stop_codon:yes gene_type:complete